MKNRLILVQAGLIVASGSLNAGILTTRPPPSDTWSPLLSLTIGGSVEFETDHEESTYDFPFLLEYNFTEWLRATIEPAVVYVDSKDPDVASTAGLGDLETSMQWEFLRERRYRPALTLEGVIKWPTAENSALGDPGWDYSLGLIASKDFIYADLDLDLRYTAVGDPESHDNFELTLAAELPLNHRLSILMESLTTFETGRGGRTTTEGTAGLSWRAGSHLRLESGATLHSDGVWQLLFSWEWNFAGED